MTKSNLSALVDAYGLLMAKRADLEGEKRKLEEALAEVPAGGYEGEKYRLYHLGLCRRKPRHEAQDPDRDVVEAYRAKLGKSI